MRSRRRNFLTGAVVAVFLAALLVLTAAYFCHGWRTTLLTADLAAPEKQPDLASAQPSPIRALMETADTMADLPFREVVLAATGRQVIAVDRLAVPDAALLDHLSKAGDALIRWLNRADSPLKNLRRINEASPLAEQELRRLLHTGDFTCTLPATSAGKTQRSGYPDLQITHVPSGRITYLDPKLFEAASRTSTLRSFYYEPDALTGKVQHDARHVLLGLSHDGKEGSWTFTGWELVDLHDFRVRLKAEFQGSNRDLYQENLLLRKSH